MAARTRSSANNTKAIASTSSILGTENQQSQILAIYKQIHHNSRLSSIFSQVVGSMGGPNLEVFKVCQPRHLQSNQWKLTVTKFGLYIMFPIAWMYYFGTNLENRFSVPDFWPKPENTHKIPFDREEIREELERLKHNRLERRARRLGKEKQSPMVKDT